MSADEHDNQDEGQGESPTSEMVEAMRGSEEAFVTEEKKPVNRSTIVLFGLILLALGGYYFMYVRTGPKAANGATAEVVQADATIKTFLAGGDDNIKSMDEMLRKTAKVVDQFKTYPSMKQIPLTDLITNPFRFMSPRGAASADDASAHRRQADRETCLRAVQEMQLQSIMHSGKRKACMINNTMYTEGQGLDDFVIEKITPQGVVLRSGPFRFELKMQK